MQLGAAATGQAGWGQAFDPARLWPVRIVAGTTSVTGNTTSGARRRARLDISRWQGRA